VKIDTTAAWRKGADHYSKLAARANAGAGVQLACLVLADYCVHQWSGDYGGPPLEMVLLAEGLVGERLDEVVAGLAKESA
jgi:hypothetical protein